MSKETRTSSQRTKTEHEQLINALANFDYPKAEALSDETDMVMKGGITSVVVYPLAICEMAKTKRFRNVGGTSAGGVAAAAAAAAELGRDKGGFNQLAGLPMDLGNNLVKTFQASPETRPLLKLLLGAVDKKSKVRRGLRVLAAVVETAPVSFASTLLVGLGLGRGGLLVATEGRKGPRVVIGQAVVAPLALALAFVAAVGGAVGSARRRLESNGYGLCRGSAGLDWTPEGPPEGEIEPFTDYLHTTLNAVAKVDDPRRHVLTFGELWGTPANTIFPTEEPRIRLEMMTTNLTHGRPMRLPFEEKAEQFWFCPFELDDYFPPPVVEHLVHYGLEHEDAERLQCPEHHDELLVPLPAGSRLPVILAVRLTLSFPILISAVPLFHVDKRGTPVRCWFSDGGVSSNFPIHFFDALWPGRPTFGITLGPQPLSPKSSGKADPDVRWLGDDSGSEPRVRDTNSLLGFVSALTDTSQNWADEGQTMLDGYRERIVEVELNKDEGGINLTMPADTILALSARGHRAAVLLHDEFKFEQHRDVRYRTAMREVHRNLENMLQKYDARLAGSAPGYREFILGSRLLRPTADWNQKAVECTDALLAVVGRAVGTEPSVRKVPAPDFTAGDAERPATADLRIVPHF